MLSSGSLVLTNTDPATMTLGKGPEALTIVFTFLTEEGVKQMIRSSLEGQHKLILTLINFNNPIGTGTNSPLEIGMLEQKKLYLSLMVYSLDGSNMRVMHYTFWLYG